MRMAVWRSEWSVGIRRTSAIVSNPGKGCYDVEHPDIAGLYAFIAILREIEKTKDIEPVASSKICSFSVRIH
jgi:hypothetical protein